MVTLAFVWELWLHLAGFKIVVEHIFDFCHSFVEGGFIQALDK
jgi:hypothetical protein